MCGIFFTASRHGHVEVSPGSLADLRARGPDSLVTYCDTFSSPHTEVPNCYLTFASSVLSLRGDQVCVQPLVDSNTGSVLCWNGEAWRMNNYSVLGNDSQVVFETLLDASSTTSVDDCANQDELTSRRVLKVLTSIAGPYAFVFYDAKAATVYYGRDRLGRRSLNATQAPPQLNDSISNDLILSSVSIGQAPSMLEVATTGIHCLRLHHTSLAPIMLPWAEANPSINRSVPDASLDSLPSPLAVSDLEKWMSKSLRPRVLNIPTYNDHNTESTYVKSSKLAILFSGGLDCTLLARLCHDLLPADQSVDLLNVAFENPRTIRAAAAAAKKEKMSAPSPYETCPDRMTGRASYAELLQVCPNRVWRFVAIDIPYAEVLSHRPTIINLMKPHNTEMDLSISVALYFAARGQGYVAASGQASLESVLYRTSARVLLSGLGADELFGGYARHAVAFSRGNWESLNNELELDFTRIGSRNLGRDDRVTSCWAKEVRYPFLDEEFVGFALGLPAWQKCGFRQGKEILKHFEENNKQPAATLQDLDPAKLILRCLIWEKGMTGVAAEKKRAIQFGARTAKMEGGQTRGTDLLA